jgi:hypothetical protein
MSLLKIYTSSQLEAQKNVANYNNTVLFVDDNFIPAWYYETTDTYDGARIQILNENDLLNGTITVDSYTIISGYSVSNANGFAYAAKKAETLSSNTIYRLQISLTDGIGINVYFSEIFKKLA